MFADWSVGLSPSNNCLGRFAPQAILADGSPTEVVRSLRSLPTSVGRSVSSLREQHDYVVQTVRFATQTA